jgi:hypothetical protein
MFPQKRPWITPPTEEWIMKVVLILFAIALCSGAAYFAYESYKFGSALPAAIYSAAAVACFLSVVVLVVALERPDGSS